MTLGRVLTGENGEEAVRGYMEVDLTERRCDCDADGVVDVPVGGLVASTSKVLEDILQRQECEKGMGWKSVMVQHR